MFNFAESPKERYHQQLAQHDVIFTPYQPIETN